MLRDVRRAIWVIRRIFRNVLRVFLGLIALALFFNYVDTPIVEEAKRNMLAAAGWSDRTPSLPDFKELLPRVGGVVLIAILGYGAWKGYRYWSARKRILRSGIRDIDAMSGADFETFVTHFYGRKGFKVRQTKHSGDFGADHVLEKDDIRYVVQAKRYRDKVSVGAIQEIVAAKGYYDAQRAIVITNSIFTPAARKLALSNQVELIDRSKLIQELVYLNKAGQ